MIVFLLARERQLRQVTFVLCLLSVFRIRLSWEELSSKESGLHNLTSIFMLSATVHILSRNFQPADTSKLLTKVRKLLKKVISVLKYTVHMTILRIAAFISM